jgi:hypothetical protein
MTFGQFYTKVNNQLRECYGFRGPVMHLAAHTSLLDVIHDQYKQIVDADPSEFKGIIEATALKVELADRNRV